MAMKRSRIPIHCKDDFRLTREPSVTNISPIQLHHAADSRSRQSKSRIPRVKKAAVKNYFPVEPVDPEATAFEATHKVKHGIITPPSSPPQQDEYEEQLHWLGISLKPVVFENPNTNGSPPSVLHESLYTSLLWPSNGDSAHQRITTEANAFGSPLEPRRSFDSSTSSTLDDESTDSDECLKSTVPPAALEDPEFEHLYDKHIPRPEWTLSRWVGRIAENPKPAVVRPYEWPEDDAVLDPQVTDSPPAPDDGTHLSHLPCMQCEMLSLPCDRKLPHCTRCTRRIERFEHAAAEHGREPGEICVHEWDARKEAERGGGPCLAVRYMTEEEQEWAQLANNGNSRVVGRVDGDSDGDWAVKLVLRQRLLEAYGERLGAANRTLPLPVARELMTGKEMWKRICDGMDLSGKDKVMW